MINPTPSAQDELKARIRKIIVEPTVNEISTADIAVGFRSSTDIATIVWKIEQLIAAEKAKLFERVRKEVIGENADIKTLMTMHYHGVQSVVKREDIKNGLRNEQRAVLKKIEVEYE